MFRSTVLPPNEADWMTSWHYATLFEVADAIRPRKTSPVELTRALLRRIDQLESSLHSYARVTPELALAHAGKAEAEIASGLYRGPLHGIPIAVKDICNTAGVVTAAGKAVHADHLPTFDAAVVKRLTAAGAGFLGRPPPPRRAFLPPPPTHPTPPH